MVLNGLYAVDSKIHYVYSDRKVDFSVQLLYRCFSHHLYPFVWDSVKAQSQVGLSNSYTYVCLNQQNMV